MIPLVAYRPPGTCQATTWNTDMVPPLPPRPEPARRAPRPEPAPSGVGGRLRSARGPGAAGALRRAARGAALGAHAGRLHRLRGGHGKRASQGPARYCTDETGGCESMSRPGQYEITRPAWKD